MPTNGGGGSSFKKLTEGKSKGPIKTILIGDRIVDTVLFQATGESIRRSESGGLGKPLGPVDPKSEVVIKRKINPETMKRTTNFFLEILILTVRASSPTARPAHAAPEFGYGFFNPNDPGLLFLARGNPTNPLVAGERGYILPKSIYLLVGNNGFL